MDSVERETRLVVVMDAFGEDWTPFAVLTDVNEALELQEMLVADADARCVPVPFFADEDDAAQGVPSPPPEELDEVAVAFDDDDVFGASSDDRVARELQISAGDGLRMKVPVFHTAEEVVDAKPSAVGQFIVSEVNAEDILEQIR